MLSLCNSMDCSPPGPSVHGILQARILEWVPMPSSRGSSQPRDQACISYVSCIGRRGLYHYCHYNIVNQIYININNNDKKKQMKSYLKKRSHLLSQSGEHCDLRPETVTAPEPARLLGGQS